MKYLILAGLLITSVLGGYAYLNQGGIGGEGTINQLQQWKFDGTYLTQSVTDRVLKLTGYESAGDCLVTDASGVVSVASCGTGGGGTGSNWTIISGGLRTSTTTDFARASYFVATSTTATSTFAGNVSVNGTTTTTNLSAVNSTTTNATTTNLKVNATTTTNGLSIASLTGFLKATAGAVSTALVSLTSDISGVLGIANGGTATTTQTTNGVNYYNGTSITSGTGLTFNGTDTVTVNGATTNAALNVKVLASSNQAMQTQMTNTTDIAFSTYNTGDSFTRFSFLADGTLKWGSGAFVGDVGLNRTASGTLALMPYGSASTVYLGIGTTTPVGKLSVQGTSGGSILQLVSSAGTKFMEMLNTGVTTLLGTWDFSGATVKQHTYKSFSFPTFATTTSATTTIDLGTAYTAESWSGADCYTSSGSVAYIFTDGTNRMNGITATTTVSTLNLSTNNTFTAKEKRYVEIGPLTSAKLVCTVDIIVNN